jgi:glycosyltransferase involved in cell wall biosynthesis
LSIRIVHVCPVKPAFTGNGLAMRVGVFSEAAASLGDAHVLVVDPRQTFSRQLEFAGANVSLLDCSHRQDTRLRIVLQLPAGEVRARAYLDYGRPVDSIALSAPVMTEVVSRIVTLRPDLIIVSRAYLFPVVERLPAELKGVPIILDLDDDDAELKRDMARFEQTEGNSDRASLFAAEAEIYDRVISSAQSRVALFTCASPKGCDDMGSRLGLTRIACVPNAAPEIDSTGLRVGHNENLLFVGSLGYRPNLDGLRWFAEEIWPRLSPIFPALRVTVAGAEPGDEVREICLRSGFHLVANPEDIRPFYRTATAAIVPLRLGSGSRIKILEAGGCGVPVISTRKGVEGLQLDETADAFISSESADDFVCACVSCLSNPPEALSRAAALKRRVKDTYLRSSIIAQIKEHLLFVKGGSDHE